MRAVTTRARTASSATKMLSSFDRRLSVIERAQNLRYSSIDGGIPVTDADGNVRVVIGVQEDGTYGVGTHNSPIPPTPEAPQALALAVGGISVTYLGTNTTNVKWPLDTDRVEIFVLTESDLAELTEVADVETGATTAVQAWLDEKGPAGAYRAPFSGNQTVASLQPGAKHYVGLRAVNTGDRKSPLSLLDEATPGSAVSPEDLAELNETINGSLSDLLRDVNSNGAVFTNNISLGEEVPQGRNPNDLWLRPDEGLSLYVWDPEVPADPVLLQWVKSPLDTAAFVDHAITAELLADSAVTAAKLANKAVTEQALADAAVSARTLTVGALADSLILNPRFEDWTDSTPTGWATQTGAGYEGAAYAKVTGESALSGTGSLRMLGAAGKAAAVRTLAPVPVVAASKFYAAFTVAADSPVTDGATVRIEWLNAAGATISATSRTYSLTTTPERVFSVGLAPAGAVTAHLFLIAPVASAGVAIRVDDAEMRRLIGGAVIADAEILTAHIADAAITNAKIGNLSAAKIDTGFLAAARIETGSLAASKINANTITADFLTANGAFIGALEATDFTAVTLTGPIIRTAGSGQRMEMLQDSSGGVLKYYTGLLGETAPGVFNPTGGSRGVVTREDTGGTVTAARGLVVLQTPNFGRGVATIKMASDYDVAGVDQGAYVEIGARLLATRGLRVTGSVNLFSGTLYGPVEASTLKVTSSTESYFTGDINVLDATVRGTLTAASFSPSSVDTGTGSISGGAISGTSVTGTGKGSFNNLDIGSSNVTIASGGGITTRAGVSATGGVSAGGQVSGDSLRITGSDANAVAGKDGAPNVRMASGVPFYTSWTPGGSLRAIKHDITDYELDPAAVLALRPRSVYLNREDQMPGQPRRHMLIAEEVEETLRDFGEYDAIDGRITGVEYQHVTVALLALAQQQQARLKEQDDLLAALEARLSAAGL